MGSYRVCVCFTRKFKSGALSPPKDVKDLFDKYSESGGQMSVRNLQRFLVEVQGQNDATEKDAENVIEVLRQRRHVSVFHRHGINLDGFFHFLFSDDLNPVIDSKETNIMGFSSILFDP